MYRQLLWGCLLYTSLLDKQTYAARTGRVRGADDVIAYHLRQSFVPGEITPEEANRLGVELARRFTKGKHAFIVCTHIDKAHVHNHIIWNSTTLECDRKFRNFWGSTRAVHRLSDTICIENGYSIVEAPKRRGQSYNKWLGDAAKPSHKEQLRQAIDRALAQKPARLEELLRLLEQDGFTVHRRGKTISIGAEGWGNNVRFDRLGDGYTLDDLLAVLSGQKEHTPRKQPAPQAAPPKVNLLVDIQDVYKRQGYTNPRKAVRDHTRCGTKRSIGVQTGKKADGTPAVQMVEMLFIPEGDVYRLIVHSKLPSAERFERWVFDEVLPSIRQHGAYLTREKLWEVATSPEALLKLCSDLLAEREKNAALQADNAQLQGTYDKDKFVSQLKEKGIDTVLRYTDEGRIYGATFIDHRTGCVLNGSRMGKELSANALQEHFTLPYAGQPPIPLSIPMDAADKAYGQTAYDREDVSGGMGLLTPEGPAVDAEEEAFIRAMKRKKKKKRKGLGM